MRPQTAPGQRACIVGIGETRFTKRGAQAGRGEWALACEAATRAADDAGLDVRRIDGLASFSSDGCLPWLMQQALGIDHLRWASMVWGGGGTGSCGALAHATAAVESGQADTVLVMRAMVQRPGGRYGEAGGFSEMPQFDLLAPFGMLMPASMFAPSARRYIHDFNVPPEAFAEVALNARANAQRNPRAVMHGQPLTLADYLASRMVADPLRRLDCCQESDGACAVIVTTQERARDLKGVPVRVLAAAQGGDAGWNAATMGTHNMPIGDYGGGNAAQLARDLYGRAGVGPADIAVAQIYDHFSPAVLWTLENFGFCGRGEAGAFVLDGQIRPDGRLPVNTAGGMLSEAYIHGVNLMTEAVRQLRGTSTTPVTGARTCLVTGGLGATPSSAAILAV